LRHNFGSRYASKPVKGSKDLDDRLDSKKTLSQNNGSLTWRPGSDNLSHKDENMPPLGRQPKKTQNEKKFKSKLEDLLNP